MMRPTAFLFIMLGLLLGGCGSQPKDCARSDMFCAGLVTDFGPVDSGIRREAWLGLQDAQAKQLVDRIDYIQTVDTRDRAANIEALAADGYDLIVTVGASIGDETRAAAAKHPRLLFIGIEQPQDDKRPNLAGLIFHEERSGFAAGALAALMSQTGQVAAVCEANFIDPIRRYCDGFQAGAQYTRPKIEATVTYREGPTESLFNDPEWGRATALQQVANGADVVFAAGGRTADAALEAAAAEGAYVIGSETDLYRDLPDVRSRLLTSAVNNIRPGLLEMITLARRGQFPAGEFAGEAWLAPWHQFDRQVSSGVKEQLERLRIGLYLGTLDPEVPYK